MLRVTIEVEPSDGGPKAEIATLEIANDGLDDLEVASYDVWLCEDGAAKDMVRVTGFDRSRGALALVHEALGKLLGETADGE